MTYHFTEKTDNQTDWWTRQEKGEYLPLFSVDQESLVNELDLIWLWLINFDFRKKLVHQLVKYLIKKIKTQPNFHM